MRASSKGRTTEERLARKLARAAIVAGRLENEAARKGPRPGKLLALSQAGYDALQRTGKLAGSKYGPAPKKPRGAALGAKRSILESIESITPKEI